jgi:trimethylamine:corrinoid methyltransferase-like protein
MTGCVLCVAPLRKILVWKNEMELPKIEVLIRKEVEDIHSSALKILEGLGFKTESSDVLCARVRGRLFQKEKADKWQASGAHGVAEKAHRRVMEILSHRLPDTFEKLPVCGKFFHFFKEKRYHPLRGEICHSPA